MHLSISRKITQNSSADSTAITVPLTIWELIANSTIIFIIRFEPSDYARKFIRRHKPTQILSFKMSFPTFGLEVRVLVIPDEPRRLCKDIEFMVKRLLKSQSVLIMHRVKTVNRRIYIHFL